MSRHLFLIIVFSSFTCSSCLLFWRIEHSVINCVFGEPVFHRTFYWSGYICIFLDPIFLADDLPCSIYISCTLSCVLSNNYCSLVPMIWVKRSGSFRSNYLSCNMLLLILIIFMYSMLMYYFWTIMSLVDLVRHFIYIFFFYSYSWLEYIFLVGSC